MEHRNFQKALNLTALGLTVSRLFVAGRMVQKISRQEGILPEMALFVGMDIADGVVARKAGRDTRLRRFLDAAVDRASVAWVATTVAKTNKTAAAYVVGLASREAIVIAANATHLARTSEVVQGSGIHKLGTLSMAAFGVVAATGHERATDLTGSATTVINFALATDYIANVVAPHGHVEDGIRKIAFDK